MHKFNLGDRIQLNLYNMDTCDFYSEAQGALGTIVDIREDGGSSPSYKIQLDTPLSRHWSFFSGLDDTRTIFKSREKWFVAATHDAEVEIDIADLL